MKYFSLLLVCFIGLNLQAQTDNKNLNEQLETMRSAFMDKDYSVLAEYTYPKVVEMMGGKENMIEATSSTMAQMEAQGFVFEKLSFKDASDFLEHNGDLQCALRQVLVMDTPNGKVQSETTLLAISKDDGENWVFLDSSGMPKASLQSFYENLHPDMVIAPSEKKNLE
jgi:hypothetical protein